MRLGGARAATRSSTRARRRRASNGASRRGCTAYGMLPALQTLKVDDDNLLRTREVRGRAASRIPQHRDLRRRGRSSARRWRRRSRASSARLASARGPRVDLEEQTVAQLASRGFPERCTARCSQLTGASPTRRRPASNEVARAATPAPSSKHARGIIQCGNAQGGVPLNAYESSVKEVIVFDCELKSTGRRDPARATF